MNVLAIWTGQRRRLVALHERYNDDGPLLAFWKRTASTRPASRVAFERRVAGLFPRGQRAAKLGDFTAPPAIGVQVNSESQLATEHGVCRGHIIVAIDGFACDTQKQYLFLRALTVDKPLDIIIWDGKNYRQVIAEVPNRRLQVDLADWSSDPKNPTPIP